MRTTVTLDDEMLRLARELTGLRDNSALLAEALKFLMERESARRLAALGATMPELKDVPRRRRQCAH